MESLLSGDEFVQANEAEVIQLVGLKLGDEEYAIDVLKIQEIIRTVEITMVPKSEAYILGVMNMRGKVVPVIDLRIRFNLEKTDFDKSTRIVVVMFGKTQIGFVVDAVTKVISIDKSLVDTTPPMVSSVGQEYVLGICKYMESLIILLDIDKVVDVAAKDDSDLRKRVFGVKEAVKTLKTPENKPKEQGFVTESTGSAARNFRYEGAPDVADVENVLEDAISQSRSFEDVQTALVNQSELDGILGAEEPVAEAEADIDKLIAIELAKREAETEEINRKRMRALEEEENSLTIDELIAAELSKREAETEERNKRLKEENKKKNKLSDEDIDLDGTDFEGEMMPGVSLGEESVTSIVELKEYAGKIISGEAKELDIDIKGEVGELLRLLFEVKWQTDEAEASVVSSHDKIPEVSGILQDVNKSTADAAMDILDTGRQLLEHYKKLFEVAQYLRIDVVNQNSAKADESFDIMDGDIDSLDEKGMKILQALEFQDINSQKINKTIKTIEEIGARLGMIVEYMRSKDNYDSKYDSVLSDLGFS